jgi:hypothetical protein
MLSSSDESKALHVKYKGSVRYGCFWASIIFLASMAFMGQTEDPLYILGGGLLIWMLLASIGDVRRMSLVLKTTFFVVAVGGTIYWSWWALPIALGLVTVMASTYAKWISEPIWEVLRRHTNSGRESKPRIKSRMLCKRVLPRSLDYAA